MSASRTRATQKPTSKVVAAAMPSSANPAAAAAQSLSAVAQDVRSWTDSVIGIAGAAADVSIGAAKAILRRPEQRGALEKTGAMLRGMREAAGLTVQEVGEAINLKDPVLLELVENGKVALPFEIILRLASVLGRNDPIPFVMRFTRAYNHDLWQTLEKLGIGRLAVQAGREREMANVYRANDAARQLSDEDFAAVLGLARRAFEMGVTFRTTKPTPPPPRTASSSAAKRPGK